MLEELGVDPREKPEKLVSILLASFVSQSTIGPYPPPAMMRDYKHVDPRIVDEILDGARAQRDHRIKLERDVTDGSEKRLDRAQRDQTATANFSIITAALLAALPLALQVELPGIFLAVPIVMILVGVGGRPVATILSKRIGREAVKGDGDPKN